MRAYYNEIDRYCCDWLSNLMDAGHITPGKIDDRDIREVSPGDVAGFERVHWFAGIAGWDLALQWAGWEGPAWTGSCPCQPFSVAGKQDGSADPRHLWPDWFRLIRECRPVTVFGEQVPGAVGHGWLDLVSADMEGEGYAVGSVVLGAHSVGAPHIRQRLWWVADSIRRRAERVPENGSRPKPLDPDDSGRLDNPAGPRRTREAQPRAPGTARHEARMPEPERRSGAGGMSVTPSEHRRAGAGRGHGEEAGNGGGLGLTDRAGHETERTVQAEHRPPSARIDRPGDPTGGGRRQEREVDSGSNPRGQGEGSEQRFRDGRPSGRPVDSERSPQERQRPQCVQVESEQGSRRSGYANPWEGSGLVECADGKARPVEPGILPLADGVPGRVGMLRAAGNAIVPQVAAEFIRAYMDCAPTH